MLRPLTLNHELTCVLVSLICESLLRGSTDLLLVSALGHITVTPNHLFPYRDSHQPLFLAAVPRDFHSICAHWLAPRLRNIHPGSISCQRLWIQGRTGGRDLALMYHAGP